MELNRLDTLKAIDCVIRNLGDNPPLPRKRKIDHVADTTTNPDLTNVIPVGKEEQFHSLYQVLQQGLIGADGVGSKKELRNVSSLLFGPRGSGKSLVLNACISALLNQNNHVDGKPRFRVVRLNGIAIKGHDVTVVLREICKQLLEQALAQSNSHTKEKLSNSNQSSANEEKIIQAKLHDIMEKETHAFRMRQTTFNNTMALVDEALQTASIDSIPILIVLEELDAFFLNSKAFSASSGNITVGNSGTSKRGSDGPSDRHVLLYHLLDRVAGKGSLVSLVGITSRLTTVGLFEKRVRSRAEGTTTVIYFFDQKSSYKKLVEILMSNFDVGTTDSTLIKHLEHLKMSVKEFLLPSSEGISIPEEDNDNQRVIMDTLSRSYDLGKTVRWFNRVLSLSLVFYSMKLQNSEVTVVPFDANCLLEAVEAMGATILRTSQDTDNDDSHGVLKLNLTSPRLQSLLDLSSTQVAILLAARRIITRDNQKDDLDLDLPLTYERIEREYESFSYQFDRSLFFKSFCRLFGGLVMPTKDSTSSMPLMYFYSASSSIQNMNEQAVKKMPIQINIDVNYELGEVLSRDLLPCNAALKDWAKFK